ncbi:MAG: hypothetical protein CVU16_14240 [Betaproteobacteria bacterium HGW-Betaproteobacteria-10]|nr:MAG: hypothetical protein CVU16_14240 [Betaproteobacteria bacterium HGW-Betaproteobacteria-10]
MPKLIWALLALVVAHLSTGTLMLASAAENAPPMHQIDEKNTVDRSAMMQHRRQARKHSAGQMPCSESSGPPCISIMQGAPSTMSSWSEAGIAYESRGIGEDDPVAELAADYNLHMVFATHGSGEYLADIKVRIDNAKGNLILDVNSPGPIFFARLPAGNYRVSASYGDKAQTKSVSVQAQRRRDLYFYWPPANKGNAAMPSQ